MFSAVRELLAHPDTRGRSIDDAGTTELRKGIIRKNRFLWRIYDEWYRMVAASLPEGERPVVEFGSGAGFLSEYVPRLITTEVFHCRGTHAVADAGRMPFSKGSLRGIAMVDVLHHIPNVRTFFAEAQRCLCRGGVLAMVEPWNSPWSSLVYRNMHHEPFRPEAADWSFPSAGPLSGANGALPWIVFQRDRTVFECGFPALKIEQVRPFMPFRYMISGGVSMRQLMPEFLFPFWTGVEKCLHPGRNLFGMFALIVLRKQEAQ
jgi:hypothetical protein